MSVLTDILIPVIAIIIGFIGTIVGGALLWLIKDKVQSVNDKIDEDRRARSREHQIVLKWLAALTKTVNTDKDEVDVPEEVMYHINPDEDE